VESSVDSAGAALPLASVLLSLISGIFVPVDQLPGWLAEIGLIFPVYHVAAGIQTPLGTAGDRAVDLRNGAVLCIWTAWGILFAARRFRGSHGRWRELGRSTTPSCDRRGRDVVTCVRRTHAGATGGWARRWTRCM
jgi:hypothetical protein